MSDTLRPITTAAGGPGLTVRLGREQDEVELVELYEAVFGRRSLEVWRWLFRFGPEGAARMDVLVHGERVAGCITHLPASAFVEGQARRLAIGCDLMIHPDVRGQGGARMLVEAFLASDHGFDVNLGCVNDASGHVMGNQAGTVTMGAVPSWVRSVRRGARSRLRAAPATVAAVCARLTSRRGTSMVVEELETLGAEADDLALASASFAPCIRARDADSLRWHWLERPDRRFRARAARDGSGALRGLAVLGMDDAPSGRSGAIVDLLAHDYTATRALLDDAWAVLGGEGCRSVSCVYSDPRPWSRRAMLHSGFRPGPPGPSLAAGPLSDRVGEVVSRMDAWYLTYGDTDI
jgi:GNAT superfamily N-acetyltransferase